MKTPKLASRHLTALSSLLAAGLTALVSETASAQAIPQDVMILIDRSGSMSEDSQSDPTTATRWEVAKKLAVDVIDMATAEPRTYGLRVFDGGVLGPPIGREIRPLGSSRVSVRNAITGPDPNLGGPTNSTPLAGAICDAIDALINYLPDELHDKYLYIFSDGLENSTPVGHGCKGPDSVSGAPYDLGSWEHKVVNKAQTGDPFSEAEPFLPLVINADFLFEYEPQVFAAFSASPVAVGTSRFLNPALIAPRETVGISAIGVASPIAGISTVAVANPIGVTAITQPAVIARDALPAIALKSPLVRSLAREPAAIKVSTVAAPVAALNSALTFFGGLTRGTGGTFRAFSSQDRLPQLGDVTGDYCVNQADVTAVRAAFGSAATAGSLLDTNQDGLVNVYDYRNVLANYGEGSGC
jgi:hypothetical protein